MKFVADAQLVWMRMRTNEKHGRSMLMLCTAQKRVLLLAVQQNIFSLSSQV